MLKVAPCTLGLSVVRSYIQIFSAWWVTTILYNYGATLCELHYNNKMGKLVNFVCWVCSKIFWFRILKICIFIIPSKSMTFQLWPMLKMFKESGKTNVPIEYMNILKVFKVLPKQKNERENSKRAREANETNQWKWILKVCEILT